MTSDFKSYREYLRFALERRSRVNPQYSLRAFARDIGLAPSRVSGILNRKQGLSREKAVQVAAKLRLSTDDQSIFCDLVESEHARSSAKKSLATVRVKERAELLAYAAISLERFRFIADWYHLALLEMVQLRGFQPHAEWIASRLGITAADARGTVRRLVKLGMLDTSQTPWKLPRRSNATSTDVPSEAIREFHQQILDKAKSALQSQPVAERDFGAMVMSVPVSMMGEAKKDLREFRRKFSAKYENHTGCDEVYCLSTQFFRLTAGRSS